MTETVWAYVVVAFALVATPGATTTVVIRHALRTGLRGGAAAAAGAAVGNSTHALSTGIGVVVLARRWPHLLQFLAVAGGLYLCWLGIASVRDGLRSARAPVPVPAAGNSRASFRDGLTVTLLNPWVPTFYLTVLPAYLPEQAGARAFALLAGIHLTLAFSCHLVWAAAFSQIGRFVASPAGIGRLDIVAGIALFVFGVLTLIQ